MRGGVEVDAVLLRPVRVDMVVERLETVHSGRLTRRNHCSSRFRQPFTGIIQRAQIVRSRHRLMPRSHHYLKNDVKTLYG